MPYEITGPITHIFDTQSVGAKGFKKREFVILQEDQKDSKWDQPIKFELTKDNCDKLDKFRVGDTVVCGFDLRGNEHNGKFYVSLQAFKLVHAGATGERPKDDNYRHGTDRVNRPPDRGNAMDEHERNRGAKRQSNDDDGPDF